jgi:hypothetical protein
MSKVAITGNTSGTGTFTIAAPNSDTDRTLTLPDEAGTVVTTASTGVMPTRYMFSARKTTAQSGLNTSAQTITFQTTTYDVGSNFSSNKFVVPVDGVYNFNFAIPMYNGTNDDEVQLYFQVNDSTFAVFWDQINHNDSGDDYSIQASKMASLSSGDEVRLQIKMSSDTSWSIWGESGKDSCYFEGFLVG